MLIRLAATVAAALALVSQVAGAIDHTVLHTCSQRILELEAENAALKQQLGKQLVAAQTHGGDSAAVASHRVPATSSPLSTDMILPVLREWGCGHNNMETPRFIAGHAGVQNTGTPSLVCSSCSASSPCACVLPGHLTLPVCPRGDLELAMVLTYVINAGPDSCVR